MILLQSAHSKDRSHCGKWRLYAVQLRAHGVTTMPTIKTIHTIEQKQQI